MRALTEEMQMEIQPVGAQSSGQGPSDRFIGTVRIDPLFPAPDPALVQGASVTFEPGARCRARASTRPDSHRCRWLRLGFSGGAARSKGPPRRRRLVFARREALAPSHPDRRYGPHRDSEK